MRPRDISAGMTQSAARAGAGLMQRGTRVAALTALALAVLGLLTGCADSASDAHTRRDETVELEVWMHAGSPAERRIMQEQVTRFNNLQYRVRVNVVILPEASYAGQVREAALAGGLPDILDFNGPFVYDYIQRGRLVPLDKLLTDNSRLDLFPAVVQQGMYQGRIYTVSTYDTGLGVYARPSRLRAAGVRMPVAIDEAWSAAEFKRVLQRLAEYDEDGAVLDLGLGAKGEWYSYAFLPVIQSAGGDLIDRESYKTAAGRLNRSEVVAALSQVQSWIKQGYVDVNDDQDAFLQGRVALSWGDHTAFERYAEAFPGDVVLLPLPDFGRGARTAQGGWGWGITATCTDRRAAMQFLEYLLQTEQVLAMAEAGAGIPATRSAASRAELYRDGGPLHLFVPQLEEGMASRPSLSAYPAVSAEFQRTVEDIVGGADVRSALDAAVQAIDRRLNGDV
jgi:multiple sugar transport system substrate-binding protein